jgi:hypothetical protein
VFISLYLPEPPSPLTFPPPPPPTPTYTHNRAQRKQERLDELEARKGELTRKVDKAKNQLKFSIPKHIAQGLENVARVVEEEGVRGCGGWLVGIVVVGVVMVGMWGWPSVSSSSFLPSFRPAHATDHDDAPSHPRMRSSRPRIVHVIHAGTTARCTSSSRSRTPSSRRPSRCVHLCVTGMSSSLCERKKEFVCVCVCCTCQPASRCLSQTQPLSQNTPNQVAAGPSLFNVVVDTDETAARLMKTLEERSLGRVCFMPLNRLRVKTVNYPDSSDVVPLLAAALEYPREVRACCGSGGVVVWWGLGESNEETVSRCVSVASVGRVGSAARAHASFTNNQQPNTATPPPLPYLPMSVSLLDDGCRWSAPCSRSSP